MKLKNLITIQKLIIYLVIIYTIFLCFRYYYPWIYTLFFDEFKASNFIDSKNYHLIKNVKGFYFRLTIETVKFIITLILLVIVLLKITKILSNFEDNLYFEKINSILLIKSGKLLMILSGILLLLNIIDSSSYFIHSTEIFFVGSLLYVFGSVFKIAYKQKQENDLTI